jgi:pyridinium-3,5-bisthiocarboxylic acid mononucleotide nickel chelatase
MDAGVPLAYLQSHLDRLGLGAEFRLSAAPTRRQGLRALKAEITLLAPPADHQSPTPSGHAHSHGHPPTSDDPQGQLGGIAAIAPTHPAAKGPSRHLPAIEHLITQADLPPRACRWSLAVFRQLAEAEAAVHGIAVEQVHFHEVGATDAIVDIVGTCLGFDYLNIDVLVCSPLPTGRGRVKAAHGWLPVPAPAVLKLMEQRQIPIYSNGVEGELVTPTGAAIVTALAQQFGDPPPLILRQVGLGAGGKDLPIANILRLWVGTSPEGSTFPTASEVVELQDSKLQDSKLHDSKPETVTVLETQVDDMLPQAVGYLSEQLLAAGALDVFTQPVGMKKSRPGLLITVICQPTLEARCTEILFAETSTLGIRHQRQQRTILHRDFKPLSTPHGTVVMKVAYHPQTHTVINVHPEYEDCAALARHHGLPWQVVYQTALNTWYHRYPLGAPTPAEFNPPADSQA